VEDEAVGGVDVGNGGDGGVGVEHAYAECWGHGLYGNYLMKGCWLENWLIIVRGGRIPYRVRGGDEPVHVMSHQHQNTTLTPTLHMR
jgi:hypothetical protein